jgi:membrane protease YdiL (CAAX protease family)
MGSAYWLFAACTGALTAFISWGTFQTARLLRVWQPDRNLLLLPAENAVRGVMVLACIGLGLLSGLPAATLGWAPADPRGDVLWGILVGAGLALVLAVGSSLAVRRWGRRVYSPTVILSVLPADRREWGLVLLALIPAIALEELLFRSLLLGGLSPVLPQGLLLVGLAAYFGLLHLPQGALGIAGTALAGLGLGLLFIGRGSLLAPLIAHYVADVIQLILAARSRTELAALR